MKIMNLFLGFGYVESEVYSLLHISRSVGDGFETPEAALGQFLKDARDVLLTTDDYMEAPKVCTNPTCKAKGRPSRTAYCGSCGTALETSQEVSRDALCEFVELLSGDCDSVGGETWMEFEGRGWTLGTTTGGEVLEVSATDRFLRGDPHGIVTMSRYLISEFKDADVPASSWVDQILAPPVDSP